jgi:autotransporter-associated beta strand protein
VLNGGTLDLTGNALGDATHPIDTLTIQAGTLLNLGPVNGTAGLTKTTTGTLALGGTHTFTGPLQITAGLLAPQGSTSLSGPLSLSPATTLRHRLNGPAPGTGYDQLTTPGDVTLTNALLELLPAPGLAAGTAFTLIYQTGPNPITGTFNNLPEGATFTSGGYTWIITYTGGTGNDLVVRIATPLESWRLAAFGTPANTGSAADLTDPDADGLSNLLEYALGSNPLSAASAAPPTVSVLPAPSSTLALSFLRARSDLTYTVEASSSLAPDSWTAIATNPGTVSPTLPVTVTDTLTPTPRRFLRLKVTAP